MAWPWAYSSIFTTASLISLLGFVDYLVFLLVGVFVKMQTSSHHADLSTSSWWMGLESGPHELFFPALQSTFPSTIPFSISLFVLSAFLFVWLGFYLHVWTLGAKALDAMSHVRLFQRQLRVSSCWSTLILYHATPAWITEFWLF